MGVGGEHKGGMRMNEYAVERLLEVLQSLTNEVQLFREAYVANASPKLEPKDEPQTIKVGMATDSVTGKVLGVTLDTDCAWK